jgi:hypothetical protein
VLFLEPDRAAIAEREVRRLRVVDFVDEPGTVPEQAHGATDQPFGPAPHRPEIQDRVHARRWVVV